MRKMPNCQHLPETKESEKMPISPPSQPARYNGPDEGIELTFSELFGNTPELKVLELIIPLAELGPLGFFEKEPNLYRLPRKW